MLRLKVHTPLLILKMLKSILVAAAEFQAIFNQIDDLETNLNS